MVRTTLVTISILFIFESFSSTLYAQYDNPIPTIKYEQNNTIVEKNIMNLTKDTVFCFYLDSKSTDIHASDKFYQKQGKIWSSYNIESKLVEKGKFKKWKPVRFYFIRLLFSPKHWFKIKRKIEHNGKIYFPKVKIGKWCYYDKNGNIIKTLEFNRLGWVISQNVPTN